MNTGKLIRWLTAMVAVLTLMPHTAQAGQAKILMADDRVVKIDAGVDRGVRVGMLAEIYTQSATLVHPVTGETYGNPKVKIARIEVTKVGAVTAEGKFIEHYAPVQPGDIVESIEVAPTAEDQIRASVAQTRAEMKEIARSLAAEIKDNDKSINDLRETLRRIGSSERRLQSIANDVRNMRERMVTFESRIVELEDNQQAMIMADTAEVKTLTPGDMTELKILRRDEEEAVYLQVGDRMYRLSFEQNALIEENPAMMARDEADGEMIGDDLLEPMEEEEEPSFYETYWWIAPVIGLLGAIVVVLMRFLKRPSEASDEEDGDEEGEDDIMMEADDGEGFPEADDDEVENFPEPEPEASPEPKEVEAVEPE
ncbi:MAG: hypothetical protein CMM29_00250 [Rhodospirillaceae bacterium]|nr:hypothetical protein [Rhodospirillaceae bacterium]